MNLESCYLMYILYLRIEYIVSSAAYKMCFGPRFYTPIKLQKKDIQFL